MHIVVDIGGTKVAVATYSLVNGSLALKKYERYYTKDHNNIIDVLRAYGLGNMPSLASITVALAAPVFSDRVQLTNLAWVIDRQELQSTFRCERVTLMNDMAAHAYGVLALKADEREIIHAGQVRAGNCAVIAPGTGLGEAMIFVEDKRAFALPCEGGHSSFAPIDAEQIQLLQFAMERHGHVSVERVVSGALGFPLLVDFYLSKMMLTPSSREALLSCKAAADVGAEISRLADEGEPACQSLMRMFVKMLGAEAGNLALKSMALGGVYVVGGMPTKIVRWLKDDAFMQGYLGKGRYADFLSDVPVYLVLDKMNAIHGLGYYADMFVGSNHNQ